MDYAICVWNTLDGWIKESSHFGHVFFFKYLGMTSGKEILVQIQGNCNCSQKSVQKSLHQIATYFQGLLELGKGFIRKNLIAFEGDDVVGFSNFMIGLKQSWVEFSAFPKNDSSSQNFSFFEIYHCTTCTFEDQPKQIRVFPTLKSIRYRAALTYFDYSLE